ncbi:heat-inducible transcriptional repressor HrcA [Sneathia sanguinegens]|uniref:heat-inducible transcriptional repressor HrcA n=1 Tax=Sneathia sanguinegens TaxID=40543 RepID=UPI0023F85A9B|nr:heat-inducible transcriptional repressor HrcA [Sneathia sanguinegens]
MNEREKQILYTIIYHYIKTGESVGSRTIEKKYDIGVSSATIRNAMADLEDKGLIYKVHTSSGRVPTEKGYKLYVDKLMDDLEYDEEPDIEFMKLKSSQIGVVLENITDLLSKVSKHTAVSLEPSIDKHKVRRLELIHIDGKRAFVVVVTDLNIVKTANLCLYNITNAQVLKDVAKYFNRLVMSGNYTYSLNDVKQFLEKIGELDSGLSDKNDSKLYVSNESNMLLYAQDLVKSINFIENKTNMKNMFRKLVEDEKYTPYEVNVVFGSELKEDCLKDSVLIFSIYEYDGERGLIALICPQRMKYRENIQLLSYVSEMLKQAINSTIVLKLPDRR